MDGENDFSYKTLRSVMNITRELPLFQGGFSLLIGKIVSEFERLETEIEDLKKHISKIEDQRYDYDD